MPRPTAPLLLALLAAAVGLVLLVAHLVVTDAEAIERLVADAARAAEGREYSAFRALLSDAYEGEGGDAEGAVERLEGAWREHGPTGVRTEVLGLEVGGDEAASRVRADVGVYGRVARVLLDVTYVREEAGWRIRSVRLAEGFGRGRGRPRRR